MIGKVMHTEFLLGETNMAAGDTENETPNTAIKLMIHMETEEEELKSIEILKNGGKVISELGMFLKRAQYTKCKIKSNYILA